MIIVINSQGKLVSQQYDNVFQGSNNVNVINLLAPFSSNVIFKANFEMPDGTIKPENLDGYIMTPSLQITNDLNSWRLPIEFPITQNYGTITMQVRGYIGNQIVCSSAIKIPIQKGIPYNADEDIEQTQYEQLLQFIQDLTSKLTDKVDIIHNKYEIENTVNEDTVGTYYVYNGDIADYQIVYLPKDYKQDTTYYKLVATGKIGNNNSGVYLHYDSGEESLKLNIEKDKVTINGKQVVVFDDLLAQNVKYDNSLSGLNSNTTQDVIDELKNHMDNIKNSQVIELGDITITPSQWQKNASGIYQYEFTHSEFKDALVQAPIITPDDNTINNLNNNDILVYPQIDVSQKEEGVAIAFIKVSKLPTFNFVASVKLQGTVTTVTTSGIRASYIVFDEKQNINKKNVQQAIEQVQSNLETFESVYNSEKTNYITTDANGKVSASLLPSYVDDVVEGYLHQSALYETRTGLGTEEEPFVYTNPIVPVSGKIYIDLETNKTYRWSGSQYTIIKGDIVLGTTLGTAYDGASGQANRNDINTNINNIQANRNDINAILDGTKIVNKSINAEKSTTQPNEDNSTNIATTEFVHNVATNKVLLWEGNWGGAHTPPDPLNISSFDFKKGDVLEFWIAFNEYGLVPIKRMFDDHILWLEHSYSYGSDVEGSDGITIKGRLLYTVTDRIMAHSFLSAEGDRYIFSELRMEEHRVFVYDRSNNTMEYYEEGAYGYPTVQKIYKILE